MLALGDALAMTVLMEKGFQPDDFANLHPKGKLGRRLKRVAQLMHHGDQVPRVNPGTAMLDVIYEMSRKGLGMTCVVDEGGVLLGIITDGDLRRKMATFPNGVLERSAGELMTPDPIAIGRNTLAAQALNIIEQRKITAIVVVDDIRRVEGVIHLHDLWPTELV
jgi:arabinose-5-phosphate isomerase